MSNKSSIDIGEQSPLDIQGVLGYYADTNKSTESGLVFKTYFGLRQFYITGGFDTRLLTLTDPKEILSTSREWKWNHVGDLRLRLMAALLHNTRLNHSIVAHIGPDDVIGWHRRSPKLNKHELAWIDIVRAVLGCN